MVKQRILNKLDSGSLDELEEMQNHAHATSAAIFSLKYEVLGKEGEKLSNKEARFRCRIEESPDEL